MSRTSECAFEERPETFLWRLATFDIGADFEFLVGFDIVAGYTLVWITVWSVLNGKLISLGIRRRSRSDVCAGPMRWTTWVWRGLPPDALASVLCGRSEYTCLRTET